MHGIWLLIFVPLGAVFGWRWSKPLSVTIVSWLTALLAVSFLGWFATTAVVGTDLTGSIYDRLMHAVGVVVTSFNVPALQVIAGCLVFVNWPSAWKFVARKVEG